MGSSYEGWRKLDRGVSSCCQILGKLRKLLIGTKVFDLIIFQITVDCHRVTKLIFIVDISAMRFLSLALLEFKLTPMFILVDGDE